MPFIIEDRHVRELASNPTIVALIPELLEIRQALDKLEASCALCERKKRVQRRQIYLRAKRILTSLPSKKRDALKAALGVDSIRVRVLKPNGARINITY